MIIGLFPELLAIGGVQRAGRHSAAVLAHYAARAGMPHRLLSLNDAAGAHQGKVGESEFVFQGFGRAKGRFATAALLQACRRPRLIMVAHPHLAPLASAMKVLAPGSRVMVLTYGMEIWTRLMVARRWALRRADLVLAISSDTARHLVAVQGVSERRVRRLPLGLDPEFPGLLATPNGEERGFHTLPDGRFVLTVGRQAPGDRGKGIDLLIQAMPRLLTSLPDVSLVVIGDGADRARLERMAHDLRVGEHIQFCGNVPVEALVAAYRRCDVFALPSRKEGFGLVFLEAMAFGKPVVGGAHGGTPDIIEDGVTGYLVRHGDVEQLAHVLERLLADDGLRKEMGRRAQEHVRRRYLFEDFERRLTAILESTLGEGLGQAAR